ncbi:uncharacterized protein LOC116140260 isoform X2 [Pistacia vera]|uniref:uncharacterized protein LOC116140260 isoform X2 n=1 Tax=Pistacia vera TaxID=55513 RepID=UPI0012634044|nr:uncharacterized protein LOC116140260 isoform X2 [Pistacia vera]
MAKSCKFARELLRKLDRLEDLVVRNKSGNTAFCLAAVSGKLELAKEMIKVAKKMVEDENYGNLEMAMIKENENGNLKEEETNKKLKEEIKKKQLEEVEMMKNNGEYLAQVKGNWEMSPLLFAVLYGSEEMVYWLYYLTKASLNDADRIVLLLALITNGFHEFALQLLEEHNELATAYYETEEKETALHALAQLPVANQQGVWKRIKRCFNRYHTLQLLEK